MKNKVNIAELLKDCPKGMELDCPIFEGLEFDHIDEKNRTYSIVCRVKTEFNSYNFHTFTEYGCYRTEIYSKCVIFPKGKTTWEGFQRPFKDGDIVAYDNPHRDNLQVFIFKDKKENNTLSSCYLMLDGDELDLEEGMYYITRLATKEEKAKLFKAIKANGYKWNEETKTLEKLIEPKFKVGNRIRNNKVDLGNIYTIIEVRESSYVVNKNNEHNNYDIDFGLQDNWELVPNKFDITTLKPFDKVLVRDHNAQEWVASLFSNYKEPKKYKYICVNGSGYAQCIPYEENKHLLGTTNDCNEYYKTW